MPLLSCFFFFNDTATTEIYTLSLHDALPICRCRAGPPPRPAPRRRRSWLFAPPSGLPVGRSGPGDRKSTRLNSSHSQISYAVFCLKKKNEQHYASQCESSRFSSVPRHAKSVL